MKILKGSNENTVVSLLDEDFKYYLSNAKDPLARPVGEYGYVIFQDGPVGNVGVNGCQIEDLLVIIIDRLEKFQMDLFACRENALALTKIQEALHWLDARTADRVERDVEGMNVL